LGSFETYGWNPDDALSEDENLMDLVLLVTRTSQLREGGMACLLVESPSPHLQSALPSSEPTAIPDDDDNDRSLRRSLRDRIAVVATNQSLYREAGGRRSSDVHAELVAVASAARRGVRTLGLAAYVTMPPCKACFPALAGAGIGRIVTRRPFLHAAVRGAADAHGVDLVVVPDTPEQRERVALLVELHRSRQGDS
jgi:deoxycytidylate deaminase